ncbi:hypothetical protein AAVH_15212, partial [Aphelenchoides avenae]
DKCSMKIPCEWCVNKYKDLHKGDKAPAPWPFDAPWHYEKGSNRLMVRCSLHKSKNHSGFDWSLRCTDLSDRQQIPCVVRLDCVQELPDMKKVRKKIVFFTVIRKKADVVNRKEFVGSSRVLNLDITYVPVKLADLITKLTLLQELLPSEAAEAGFDRMFKIYEKRGYPTRISLTLDGGNAQAQVAQVDTPPQNIPEDQQSVDGPPDNGPASVSALRADVSSAMSMMSDAWDHGFDIQQQKHEEAVVSTAAAEPFAQEDLLTKLLLDENKRLEELVRQLQAQLHKGQSTSDGAVQTPKRDIDEPSTSEKRQRLSGRDC